MGVQSRVCTLLWLLLTDLLHRSRDSQSGHALLDGRHGGLGAAQGVQRAAAKAGVTLQRASREG
eukprot:COSAG02_NODE_44465_length_366_cov_0.580524_1_plen_63_part_10